MTWEYITTDPQSTLPLERGKRYFMDFDISGIPIIERGTMTPQYLTSRFVAELRERGHEVKEVTVSIPRNGLDYPNTLRFQFTVENPPPVVIIVAIAIGIIAVSVGTGYGIFTAFKGIGEVPGKIIRSAVESATQNPIAVIGILIVIGVFILGRKL